MTMRYNLASMIGDYNAPPEKQGHSFDYGLADAVLAWLGSENVLARLAKGFDCGTVRTCQHCNGNPTLINFACSKCDGRGVVPTDTLTAMRSAVRALQVEKLPIRIPS